MDPHAATDIMGLLDPVITPAEDGHASLRFAVKPAFTIPGDVVQGGIVSAMLDMAMAMAGGGRISTISLQVDILRPAKGPSLHVKGWIRQKGRRVVFAEAEMRDAEGRMVATGRQTAVPLP